MEFIGYLPNGFSMDLVLIDYVYPSLVGQKALLTADFVKLIHIVTVSIYVWTDSEDYFFYLVFVDRLALGGESDHLTLGCRF